MTGVQWEKLKKRYCRMVVIGASAGGVEVLQQLFSLLSAQLAVPVVTVLHLHDDSQGMTGLFAAQSRLPVREAEAGLLPRPGEILLAPAGYHIYFERDCRLGLAVFDRVNFTRPSIDPFFDTAAAVYGSQLCAVVLTGASDDGSRGLQRAAESGALPLVQDPEEATVASMPLAALRRCSSAMPLTAAELADAVNLLGGGR